MWFLLLLLLAPATSAELNSNVRQTTREVMAYDLQFKMNRVLNCLLSNTTDDIPSPINRMADRIKSITTALKGWSSNTDLKKIKDEIQEMHGFLKTEFQQVYRDFEPAASFNYTAPQLCEPLGQQFCVANELCGLGKKFNETSKKLEEFINKNDNAISLKVNPLTKQQYSVASGPHAYILHGTDQPGDHHCILEMEGWGVEDNGFSLDRPFIKINGRALLLPARRGVLIISLTFKNQECIVGSGNSYDTWASDSEANALNVMLERLPIGTGIAAVTNDEFTNRIRRPAETLLRQYGIYLNLPVNSQSMWYCSSAAWFGVKGDPSQARVQHLPRKAGPAKLVVDSMDVKFSPWGKGFIRYPGMLFTGEKFTMIKAATGSDHDCITRCAVSRGCKTVNVLDQDGQKLCHMFTARGGYPGTGRIQAGHATMYKLAYIP